MKHNKETRSGAKALIEALEKAGVDTVFGYPGGNVIDIFDCAIDAKFRFILGRHEQGCVHMADGYARASGRTGVILVTSGPGLTNAISGLGAANMDGIPLVLICGQVPLSDIGTDAFQEADTTGLTRAVSKHNFLVKSADEIPETIAQAFHIAKRGKPGVVVIDVPRDCQRALTASRHPLKVSLRAYLPERPIRPSDTARLASLLNSAKGPLIYAGGGVIAAEASADVAALSKKASIPVITTMTGIGSIDSSNPLALGMAGVHGSTQAKKALAHADVVLALGVRFNDRISSPLLGKTPKIIHVDCDASVIGRNVPATLGIVADVKDLLTSVSSRIRPASHDEWLKLCHSFKPKNGRKRRGKAIQPESVIELINRLASDGFIAVTDVGQHQIWAARDLKRIRPRHFISSGGMGAMGFGLPAAIGAAIARSDRKVIAFLGDGGAQMTAEELAVASELNLQVTFIVFSNNSLGLVRQMQKTECSGRFFATKISSPDFVKLASAYGIKAGRVSEPSKLETAIARALNSKGPYLLEVKISEEAEI